jgi:hypothetical protein
VMGFTGGTPYRGTQRTCAWPLRMSSWGRPLSEEEPHERTLLPVTVAAILMALISLAGLPSPLLPGSEEVPEVLIYGGIVL